MSWWNKFYKENKAIVIAAVIGIVLAIGVLIKVKDEVTRFTLIMPIFAGFILFSILMTADEDLEDEDTKVTPAHHEAKRETPKPKKKSSKR